MQVVVATPRQLESLVRLSESLARMRLAEEVGTADVAEVRSLCVHASMHGHIGCTHVGQGLGFCEWCNPLLFIACPILMYYSMLIHASFHDCILHAQAVRLWYGAMSGSAASNEEGGGIDMDNINTGGGGRVCVCVYQRCLPLLACLCYTHLCMGESLYLRSSAI